MLVIADGKGPVALAGIMGGAETEVSSKTTALFIEVATFDKKNIRKTSKPFNLDQRPLQDMKRALLKDWSLMRPTECVI